MLNIDRLRLIDANANRAREGIRTAEDYLRFAVGVQHWAARLQSARGKITALIGEHLGEIGERELIASRNVGQDPLRPLEGDTRPCAEESCKLVAQRGLKRAQEAVRVLEEYLRGPFPAVSKGLEKCRYELYEAEQWLAISSEDFRILNGARVYVLLTEALCTLGLIQTAEAVLKGGVRLLQLREKAAPDTSVLGKLRGLRPVCAQYGAVLICNDRFDLALAGATSGVHLGQGDLSPQDVRAQSGQRLLIGRSTHDVEQAQRAAQQEAPDYIAIGSMYETATKQERIMAGLGLAERVSALNLPLPVFAIGGITPERVGELKKTGIRRIAVAAAVTKSRDPESAARQLIELMA